MIWVHLSQVPAEVREALATAEEPFREEDARLEEAILRSLREQRLRARVQALLQAARGRGLSLRQAFTAVSLHAGLADGLVRQIHYRRRA